MIKLDDYLKLNASFSKSMVFRLGYDSGFYSEFNNMIYAMAYCLRHGIRFRLYSQGANFSHTAGFSDYFTPFLDKEDTAVLYKNFNHRYPDSYYKNIPQIYRRIDRFLHVEKLSFFLKEIGIIPFMLHDLWYAIRSQDSYEVCDVQNLGFSGDFRELCRELIEMIYVFNQDTRAKIDAYIMQLELPSDYIGIHVRSGDKHIEHPLYDVRSYISHITEGLDVKHVFILTDDYRCYDKVCKDYPDMFFYTLCLPSEQGYFHKNDIDKLEFSNALVRLFASMEVLHQSKLFIGTYSANPGNFLGMRTSDPSRVIGIDYDRWELR